MKAKKIRKEVDKYGTIRYYNKNDELHREDGPAVITNNGGKFWFINDKRHREDGPAMILSNGEKRWYQNDKFHRLDGPAIEHPNGSKLWFIEGEMYDRKEFNLFLAKKKAKIKKLNKYKRNKL